MRPSARALPPSILFFLRCDQLRADSLLFDHLLDATRYAGFRAPVAIHLTGQPEEAEPEALAMLAGRGRILVEPQALPAATRHPVLIETEARPRAATVADLLAAPHLMAWFAHAPALPAAAALGTRIGVAHLDALALAGQSARASRLAAAFPRFLLLSGAPSRAVAEIAAATGAERLAVPLLWRGEDSRLLAALRSRRRGPVALLAERADTPALLPLLAFLTGAEGHEVRLFHAGGALPDWPRNGPLALRAEAVTGAPLAEFFQPGTWAAAAPTCVVEHGRPAGCAVREAALRAGLPYLSYGDPAAPPVLEEPGASCARARGFAAAALHLASLGRAVPAAGPDAAVMREFGHDAGWARMWREIGDLVAG